MKKRLIPLAALIILLLAGPAADAYNTHGHWSDFDTTMRASATSFPAGNAYRTALGTVASRFNQNPSEFHFHQRSNPFFEMARGVRKSPPSNLQEGQTVGALHPLLR